MFAPSNEAFAKFFMDNQLTLNDLKKSDSHGYVSDILSYHVSIDASHSMPPTAGLYRAELETLLDIGSVIVVSHKTAFLDMSKRKATPETISVGLASPLPVFGSITTADIPASNGVVHVIDRVLVPPQNVAYTDKVSLLSTNGSMLDILKYSSQVGLTLARGPGRNSGRT